SNIRTSRTQAIQRAHLINCDTLSRALNVPERALERYLQFVNVDDDGRTRRAASFTLLAC
ncbi:unnamed protein product, partial [Rotaria magnacalcarata]